MGYAIAQNPDWKLEFTAFADDNPDFPMLTGKGRQFVLASTARTRSSQMT